MGKPGLQPSGQKKTMSRYLWLVLGLLYYGRYFPWPCRHAARFFLMFSSSFLELPWSSLLYFMHLFTLLVFEAKLAHCLNCNASRLPSRAPYAPLVAPRLSTGGHFPLRLTYSLTVATAPPRGVRAAGPGRPAHGRARVAGSRRGHKRPTAFSLCQAPEEVGA